MYSLIGDGGLIPAGWWVWLVVHCLMRHISTKYLLGSVWDWEFVKTEGRTEGRKEEEA